MKRQLKELQQYTLVSKDSYKAKIKDFLFDKESWLVRYAEANFGEAFSRGRILIPRNFIQNYYLVENEVYINLTKKEIENCPRPEDDLPISRKHESELNKHYNIENYWSYTPAFTASANPISNYISDSEQGFTNEQELNTNLNSFNEVKGYDILGLDGKIGHLEDLIIDDDWKILYGLVDTNKWLPFSKRILLETRIIEDIDFKRSEIKTHLQTEVLRDAPVFDNSDMEDSDFFNKLRAYYDRSLLKM